ncbi:MAG: D-amino acid dehydrogenase [Betaproteobacteria bacterium]|nr:D-amino acid dehydrogenase [Betaproteobacteria bacterium]MDH5352327.1 D-amino acid dehydrogenase [Betaproteobacteria bacterium]
MRVAVLGAGVVGVTGAWYLARAGHEVTLVDRQPEAGMETSFANGGQISAGHAEPWAKPSVVPKVLRWLGREDAPMLFRPRADLAQWRWGLRFAFECLPGRFERHTRQLAGLARYSRESLGALRQETGIAYDYLGKGILHFCTDEADFEALAAHAEKMRRLGIAREVKTAAECLAIEPALRASEVPVAGGAYAPQDESGDAHAFTVNLARLAQARGVRFLRETTIESLETESGRAVAARLGSGRLEADAFVVSLGSYSTRLLRPLGISIPVYPLKGYSITIALPPQLAAQAPTASLTDEAHKLVFSRLGERLRVAGTAELTGYDTSINEARCAAIMARVGKLFPGLAQARDIRLWAGLRPATPSNVPVIGRTRVAKLFLNTGHGTLGWTLAAGSGRALADLVSGRKPEVEFRFH